MSLVEILVGMALLTITVSVSYSFYTATKLSWAYALNQSGMQRDAMAALEKMVYGIDANREGITVARNVTAPAAPPSNSDTQGSQIDFWDPDTSILLPRSFFVQNNQLVFMDTDSTTTIILDADVDSLTFTRPAGRANLIQINLALQRSVLQGKKIIDVSVNTSVELRNFQ